MIDDPDVPSLTSKRQRHDDPGDALNVEPPAKISKTGPGPMRHHREESTNLMSPDSADDELEKNVIESVKHVNSASTFSSKRADVTNPFQNQLLRSVHLNVSLFGYRLSLFNRSPSV